MRNTGATPAKFTMDFTKAKNLVFSEPATSVTRLVQPGATEFLTHAETIPGTKGFTHPTQYNYEIV